VKRTAPLALRNLDLVRAAVVRHLPATAGRAVLLELGSGTGEQALALARALPRATVQPSDPDPEARASIAAWAAEARLPNLRPPLDLDLLAPAWRRQPADLLLCVNVLHLAPAAAVDALLDGGAALPPGGRLVLYGPFSRSGERPERLVRFDAELRRHDPRLGVQPLERLLEAARTRGLTLEEERPGTEEGDRLLVLAPAGPPPGAGR
jgi:SAM-dependent methyltransferase